MVFEHYLSAFFIISIIVLLYGIYYILSYTKIQTWIYRNFAAQTNESIFHAVFFRMGGFCLFGITSAVIFKSYDVEFDFLFVQSQYMLEIGLWSCFLTLFFILVAYINVKNSKQSHYPQFKIDNWTVSYKLLTYFSWILYLLGYEFMFRGILLFGIVEEVGYYPAIIFNVALYAFVHIPKGKKEVLGCLMLGPILCVLALKTNCILIPIIVHNALCLSNEYFSIRTLNPKKSIILR
jgi:membrane protease YdiL (CAAX protease family)